MAVAFTPLPLSRNVSPVVQGGYPVFTPLPLNRGVSPVVVAGYPAPAPAAPALARATSAEAGKQVLQEALRQPRFMAPTAVGNIRAEANAANPVPRGDQHFAGGVSDFSPEKDRSNEGRVAKDTTSQPRVCDMCDQCWIAQRSKHRNEILKCPFCGSTQKGDDEYTPEEFEEMRKTCRAVKAAQQEKRNQKMADASRERAQAQGGRGF